MVEIIDTGIPQETNNRIIQLIKETNGWEFAIDSETNPSEADKGMYMFSYSVKEKYMDATHPINCNAFFIYDIITSKLQQKFSYLHRVVWNVYWKSISEPDFHSDFDSHRAFTFIYNLHDNDGGTEIKIADKNKFYISKGGQAIVFPSRIQHRGVEPKTEKMRFSLAFSSFI